MVDCAVCWTAFYSTSCPSHWPSPWRHLGGTHRVVTHLKEKKPWGIINTLFAQGSINISGFFKTWSNDRLASYGNRCVIICIRDEVAQGFVSRQSPKTHADGSSVPLYQNNVNNHAEELTVHVLVMGLRNNINNHCYYSSPSAGHCFKCFM